VDVYKQPVTDPAKVSKKGRMTLELDEDTGQYVTRQQGTGDPAKVQGYKLASVWLNSLCETSFFYPIELPAVIATTHPLDRSELQPV